MCRKSYLNRIWIVFKSYLDRIAVAVLRCAYVCMCMGRLHGCAWVRMCAVVWGYMCVFLFRFGTLLSHRPLDRWGMCFSRLRASLRGAPRRVRLSHLGECADILSIVQILFWNVLLTRVPLFSNRVGIVYINSIMCEPFFDVRAIFLESYWNRYYDVNRF